VFAVANNDGKVAGDVPENYVDNDGVQKLRNIRGWVIAATEPQGRFRAMVNVPGTKAPAGTSGWYWGAVNQYLILAQEYATVTVENRVVIYWEYLAVGKWMETRVNNQAGTHFSTDGEQFYWSSTAEESTGKLFRVGLLTTGQNYGNTAGWKLNDPRHCRPILTF